MRRLQGSFLKMSFASGWGARVCRAGCSVLGFPTTTVPMPEGFGMCPLGNGIVPCGPGCPGKQLGQPLLSMLK